MRTPHPIDIFIHRWLRLPYRLRAKKMRRSRKAKLTVVLIHGIGNSLSAWDELVRLLPEGTRVIGVDLLGFGQSPKPRWARYNVVMQARSVAFTLLNMGIGRRWVVVGHSLGALVAIELAKRYPLLVKQLLLCSPPLYLSEQADAARKTIRRDDILKNIYRTVQRYPEQMIRLAPFAVKLGVANKSLELTNDNVAAYIGALEASIINQTSLEDVRRVIIPTRILYGALDPVVIGSNIRAAAKLNEKVTARRLMVGHEVTGQYTKAVAKELTGIVDALSGRS